MLPNSDRCSTGNGFKIVKVIAEIDTAVRNDATVRQLGQFSTLQVHDQNPEIDGKGENECHGDIE